MLTALSGKTPPKSLARVVFEETEGNPFFVEEVFRHLIEEGKLFDEKSEFLPGLKVDELHVPESLRLVLGRRLQRLGEDTRRILTTCALIGRSFSLPLLEELEGPNFELVFDSLEQAERAYLVEPEVRLRETRYRFVHELVRQTLIGALSLPRRQRLHARIAEALEHVTANLPDKQITVLAHHLYEAGLAANSEKTVRYLSEAAEEAIAAAAYEESLNFIDKALASLGQQSSISAGILQGLRGTTLLSLLRIEEAIDCYKLALDFFQVHGDREHFVEYSVRLTEVLQSVGRLDELIAATERTLNYAGDDKQELRACVLALTSAVAAITGQIDLALEKMNDVKTFQESGLSSKTIGIVTRAEVHVRYLSGEFRECERAAKRATEINQRMADIWWQAEIDYGNCIPAMCCGRPHEAQSAFEEALIRAAKIGNVKSRISVGVRFPGIALAQGDLAWAERIARETLEFAKNVPTGFRFNALCMTGHILSWKGQTEEAIELLSSAVGGNIGAFQGLPEGELAAALATSNDVRASSACDSALNLVPRAGISKGIGPWHAVIGSIEALRLLSRNTEAGGLLGEAEKIIEEWDVSLLGFPVRTIAGIAASCVGYWDRAEQHHRRSIERMDEVPYACAGLIARYWYADMLLMRGKETDVIAARNLLRQTIKRCRQIDLSPYTRLATELLDRSGSEF